MMHSRAPREPPLSSSPTQTMPADEYAGPASVGESAGPDIESALLSILLSDDVEPSASRRSPQRNGCEPRLGLNTGVVVQAVRSRSRHHSNTRVPTGPSRFEVRAVPLRPLSASNRHSPAAANHCSTNQL
ncbi:hypothetical protein C9J85_02835 [Haloferax sp. wsp5]|nr:hypothetical protein C9J85_02835 [Haloferax sp. wsp5]